MARKGERRLSEAAAALTQLMTQKDAGFKLGG